MDAPSKPSNGCASLFQRLPPETIEHILSHLSLSDIKSLRLACAFLAGRCLGPRFLSAVAHQSFSLTSPSLDRVASLAKHPICGPAVKHITILADVFEPTQTEALLRLKRRIIVSHRPHGGGGAGYNWIELTEEELQGWVESQREAQRGREEEWMAAVAEPLANVLHAFGAIPTLDLDARVVCCRPADETLVGAGRKGGAWYPTWLRAAQVYRSVMAAVALSGVAVENLLVYHNTPRCSIPTADVTHSVEQLRSLGIADDTQAPWLTKTFALSMSTRVPGTPGAPPRYLLRRARYSNDTGLQSGRLDARSPAATAGDNFPSVAALLARMSFLCELELHMYTTLGGEPVGYERVFSTIAARNTFPQLRTLRLRGLRVMEADLLRFLRAHEALKDVFLRQISLTTGSWTRVFAHLGTGMPSLTRLQLSNLYGHTQRDGFRLLNLALVGEDGEARRAKHRTHTWMIQTESFPCMHGETMHTNGFARVHLDTRKGLVFEGSVGPAMGSPEGNAWAYASMAEFGPLS